MQWKTITTTVGNKAFALWSNGQKMLTLAYKSKSDTIYCESEAGEKRSFHSRKKGLFKNKIVLENEYGVNLGKLQKEGNKEYVIVDEKKYFLNYHNNKEVEIIDEEFHKSLATCKLDYENPNSNTNQNLLMVLCLYMFRQEQIAQTALSN